MLEEEDDDHIVYKNKKLKTEESKSLKTNDTLPVDSRTEKRRLIMREDSEHFENLVTENTKQKNELNLIPLTNKKFVLFDNNFSTKVS